MQIQGPPTSILDRRAKAQELSIDDVKKRRCGRGVLGATITLNH
jgi:hypothetical protein